MSGERTRPLPSIAPNVRRRAEIQLGRAAASHRVLTSMRLAHIHIAPAGLAGVFELPGVHEAVHRALAVGAGITLLRAVADDRRTVPSARILWNLHPGHLALVAPDTLRRVGE